MRSRLTVVLASTLLYALLPTVAAHAAFPGANGRIAFTSSSSLIDTVNPDGTGQSSTQQRGTEASWSADGKKIVFRGNLGHISTMNADGSGLTSLNVVGDYPSWAPDGASIAFSIESCVAGPDTCNESSLYVMNADGSGVTRVPCQICLDYAPVWSPDGSWLAFWGAPEDGGQYGIYKVRPDGSELTRVFMADNASYWPDWSPDGTKIVFEYYPQLATVNADGTGLTIIDAPPSSSQPDDTPAWSPDGTKIAFWTPASLFVINADGTGKTQLVGGSFNGYPDWQPGLAPQRGDYPSAREFCLAEREFLGRAGFVQKYGRNAYRKCVRRNGGRNRPKDHERD
jgi:Tol biopolymer transport system component